MDGANDPIDYRVLFRSTPAAMLVLDTELVIVDVTDAYLTATMRTREELIGRPVLAAFPDNPEGPAAGGVSRLAESLHRVLRDGVTTVMPVHRYDIAQPGGGFQTRYWAPVTAPVFTDGAISHVVHRVEDVTAYVHAREGGVTDQLADELEA